MAETFAELPNFDNLAHIVFDSALQTKRRMLAHPEARVKNVNVQPL